MAARNMHKEFSDKVIKGTLVFDPSTEEVSLSDLPSDFQPVSLIFMAPLSLTLWRFWMVLRIILQAGVFHRLALLVADFFRS